jgi:phosphoribosylglycinamide formyltransferase 1
VPLGRLAAVPALVISNNADAEVLARAKREGIPHAHLSGTTHPDPTRLDGAILDALVGHDVELVVLAGYVKKLGPQTLRRFRNRVLNAERETGVTIHLADGEYDHGRTLGQCRVPVVATDTVDSLSARVLEREHAFLVETLGRIVSGKIALP